MAASAKFVALNLGLAAALGLIVWQGRVKWDEAQAVRRANVNVPLKRVTLPPIAAAQKPDTVQAMKYADVAAKNPFSKDRNPTVVVEAPKVDPPKVMPPLPVSYGAMALPSGIRAIMAEHTGAQSRPMRVGDSIGPFKILALDLHKVTFEWDGKPVERNLEDLVDRSGAAASNASARGPAAPGPAAGPAPTAAGAAAGTDAAAERPCKAGDNSPAGTVVDGYRKVGIDSPFGLMGCKWVAVK